MPRKATAPRRKPKAEVVPRELRGTKLTASKRVCNNAKWAELEPIFSRVCALKNRMSEYVRENGLWCITDAYGLKAQYKLFKSTQLNAWERQALFHDIVGDYQRALSERFSKGKFRLQSKWVYDSYKRAVVKTHRDGTTLTLRKKGDLKPGTFRILGKTSSLLMLANYLLRVDAHAFDPYALAVDHPMRDDFLRLAASPEKWRRLKNLACMRQQRLIDRQPTVNYVTGTYRVNPAICHTEVIVDNSNKEHRLWLKLRVGVKDASRFLHVPLQANRARLRSIADGDIARLGLDKEFRLKFCSGRKLHVCTTYEARTPQFPDESKSLGLDLNTKRAFMNDSDGRAYYLDQLIIGRGLALLAKIDAEGGMSRMSYRRSAQLRQWLRRNEAAIKAGLSGWCQEWAAAGVSDLWLENLSISHDMTFLRHPVLGAKYSRVLRLMRLSGVKDWLFTIAEKRGIRVHMTNCAYSSQECPACHHIERANRPKQEVFCCVVCGCSGDADHIAAVNLKNRGNPALRARLHKIDQYGRCSDGSMNRSVLKSILMAQRAGEVTGLPAPAIPTKWTLAQAKVLQEDSALPSAA